MVIYLGYRSVVAERSHWFSEQAGPDLNWQVIGTVDQIWREGDELRIDEAHSLRKCCSERCKKWKGSLVSSDRDSLRNVQSIAQCTISFPTVTTATSAGYMP